MMVDTSITRHRLDVGTKRIHARRHAGSFSHARLLARESAPRREGGSPNGMENQGHHGGEEADSYHTPSAVARAS
jgi:hypothetical protein